MIRSDGGAARGCGGTGRPARAGGPTSAAARHDPGDAAMTLMLAIASIASFAAFCALEGRR